MNLTTRFRNKLFAKVFACRITSGKESVQYGIRFSYPIFVLVTALGTVLESPFILLTVALIAVLGLVMPLHPFDYLYNYSVGRLSPNKLIPGRGTEMKVNSGISLIYSTVVAVLLLSQVSLNYTVMALLYVCASIYFIGVQLKSG